jgi:glutathione synthase/RimK-type ligase-like ATP-grasp enzyme
MARRGKRTQMTSIPADVDGAATKLKVLVMATQRTPLAGRISIALDDSGFCVATLTPRGHPARRLRRISHHFACRAGRRWKSALSAIDRWSPDFLVPTDDLAVRELQALHRRMAASGEESRRRIADVIEFSLGPAASFPATHNKSDFIARVEAEGLRCPRTVVIPAARAFKSLPPGLNYPIVVKADHSYGGMCVRIADGDGALRAAVWELQTPATWHSRVRRLAGAILGSDVFARLALPLRRTISLQEYIHGRPCNRAVICWNGKVLAGISAEAMEVAHEYGPASVVRLIDHPEMTMVAGHMVKCLNLSGFVGFDFVLDSSKRARVIEMNPRVTPICHLSAANGTNLTQALYRQLTGLPPLPAPASADRVPIALFPGEIVRAPSSEYIRSYRHDVPWNEPQFVHCVLDQALRRRVLTRLRTFLEHRLAQLTGALVRVMRRKLGEAPCRDGGAEPANGYHG